MGAAPEHGRGGDWLGDAWASYKGFSKGGGKTLFTAERLALAERVIVTESAIDAMSLATLEDWRDGTVYASTGGGYGPETEAALRGLLLSGVGLVAATDLGTGGNLLALRLKALATLVGATCTRLFPRAKDWNEQLGNVGTMPCTRPRPENRK